MQLHTSPLDLSSAALGARMDGPLPPCILATKLVPVPRTDLRLHLGIIGGSHVATVADRSGRALVREELSCHAVEAGKRLRRGVEMTKEEGELRYSFAAMPQELSGAEFSALVDYLQERGAVQEERSEVSPSVATTTSTVIPAAGITGNSTPHWLVGEFPGEERGHLTALAAECDNVGILRWRTWHLYPTEQVAVFSESAFSLGAPYRRIDLPSLRSKISREI